MKAITIRQPWASLIAAGVKTIETRPRSTSYRGRIAIHAAKAPVASLWHDARDHPHPFVDPYAMDACWRWDEDVNDPGSGRYAWVGPYSAVVASAVLKDCVPTVHSGEEGAIRTLDVDDNGQLWIVEPQTDDEVADGLTPEWREITDQLPYGDFTPGRWALLLDDIKPTTARCPWCWGDGEDLVTYDQPCRVCSPDPLDELGPGYCGPVPARGQQAVP